MTEVGVLDLVFFHGGRRYRVGSDRSTGGDVPLSPAHAQWIIQGWARDEPENFRAASAQHPRLADALAALASGERRTDLFVHEASEAHFAVTRAEVGQLEFDGPQSIIKDEPERQRLLIFELLTEADNPIIDVAVTAEFEDGTTLQARTDERGLADLGAAPPSVAGDIECDDLEEVLIHGFAADYAAAIAAKDEGTVLRLLHATVDQVAVAEAYERNYGAKLAEQLESVFDAETREWVVPILVVANGLAPASKLELIDQSPGVA